MNSGGSQKSEFLSDHPSDEKRIAALQKEMPEALKYYNPPTPAPTAKKATAKKATAKKSTTKKTTSTKKKTTTKRK